MLFFVVLSCSTSTVSTQSQAPEPVSVAGGDCSKAKNVCPSYSEAWKSTCPDGQRCLTFTNRCAEEVVLSYQVGCNGDGTPGAPQCNCTEGPTLVSGATATFTITDADYTSCLPSWQPACLTAGLAVVATKGMASGDCLGTRVEFTAGNSADPYGRFDSYDIDLEKGFSMPVDVKPDLVCANDHANHDCRPLYCGSATCPDAYATPTTGGCPDGRSPQTGCQDTFGQDKGYMVTFCPSDCTSGSCPSCEDAVGCQ